jgi:hypothetical protein
MATSSVCWAPIILLRRTYAVLMDSAVALTRSTSPKALPSSLTTFSRPNRAGLRPSMRLRRLRLSGPGGWGSQLPGSRLPSSAATRAKGLNVEPAWAMSWVTALFGRSPSPA